MVVLIIKILCYGVAPFILIFRWVKAKLREDVPDRNLAAFLLTVMISLLIGVAIMVTLNISGNGCGC